MNTLNIRKSAVIGSLVIILLLASACASLRGPSSLEDRAQARWDALIESDWETAYNYLSPGARSALSQEAYAKVLEARTIRWVAAQVSVPESCTPETQACTVPVEISYTVNRGVPGLRRQITLTKADSESWIYSDRAWYFVPDRLR